MSSGLGDRPVFFVHIMKTGGTTLVDQIRANVPNEARYPFKAIDPDMTRAKLMSDDLLSQPDDRLATLRAYHPHVPFCVSRLVPGNAATITLLRHPVDRVVSHIKRLATRPDWEVDAEQIYANVPLRSWWLVDHQVRVFALTEDDCVAWDENVENLMKLWPDAHWLPQRPMDESHLALAKRNLDTVDIVGLTEDFEGLFTALEGQWGWTIKRGRPKNRGNQVPVASRLREEYDWRGAPERTVSTDDVMVPDSLREQIEADNRLDLEFYEYAKALVGERSLTSTG